MAAMLTFYPRRALLEATAAGRMFYLPVYRDPVRVASWEKAQELRPGKVTLWDHSFELPGGQLDTGTSVIGGVSVGPRAMEAYDFPGAYAQRFDGVDKGGRDAFHSHAGSALYVGPRSGGVYVHGLPVCNRRTCIIVLRQWEELRRAIAAEKRLRFSIAV